MTRTSARVEHSLDTLRSMPYTPLRSTKGMVWKRRVLNAARSSRSTAGSTARSGTRMVPTPIARHAVTGGHGGGCSLSGPLNHRSRPEQRSVVGGAAKSSRSHTSIPQGTERRRLSASHARPKLTASTSRGQRLQNALGSRIRLVAQANGSGHRVVSQLPMTSRSARCATKTSPLRTSMFTSSVAMAETRFADVVRPRQRVNVTPIQRPKNGRIASRCDVTSVLNSAATTSCWKHKTADVRYVAVRRMANGYTLITATQPGSFAGCSVTDAIPGLEVSTMTRTAWNRRSGTYSTPERSNE